MGQTLDLECSGLYSFPNELSLPKGAMLQADNVVIDRPGVAERRRGFRTCANIAERADKLFVYRGRLITHDRTTGDMYWDSSGNCDFIKFAQPLNGWLFSTYANGSVFFNSNTGVYKLDAIGNPLRRAGAPRALGAIGSFVPSVSAVVPTSTSVAYRVVWGIRDANANLILGAPSSRLVMNNNTGSDQDVELQIIVPDQIDSVEYFYQVYRSNPSNFPIEASHVLYLLDEIQITAADILNGFAIFNDEKTTTGATLYTSPSQEGIAAMNMQPPICNDLCTFNGMTFYAGTTTRHQTTFTLNKNLTDGQWVSVHAGDFVATSNLITNITNFSEIAVGQKIEGLGIPAGTFVTAVLANAIFINNPVTVTGVSQAFNALDSITVGVETYVASLTNDFLNNEFAVTDSIEETCLNLVNLINSNSVTYNAYYLGDGDVQQGDIFIETVNASGPSFTVSSTNPTAFIADFPLNSSNESIGNRIYVSKINQPESVPLPFFYDCGLRDFPVMRVISLRDAAYVFKYDGIFRITGSTPENLSIDKFYDSAVLRGIETPAILDNEIYCYTDLGAVTVSENGINIISRQLERTLLTLSSDRNIAFQSVAFGVGYETERKYMLFVNDSQTDSKAKKAYVFNAKTKTWTRWIMEASHAIVNIQNDRMYHSDGFIINEERKDYLQTDFSDNSTPIPVSIQFYPNSGGNPGIQKHFREATLFFGDSLMQYVDVTFSNSDPSSAVTTRLDPVVPGNFEELRTLIPLECSRGAILNTKVTQDEIDAPFTFLGMSLHMENTSSRVR